MSMPKAGSKREISVGLVQITKRPEHSVSEPTSIVSNPSSTHAQVLPVVRDMGPPFDVLHVFPIADTRRVAERLSTLLPSRDIELEQLLQQLLGSADINTISSPAR